MRFSDMMGSGEEPAKKDSAVSDALAPYLDTAAAPKADETETPAPRTPTVESVFPVIPVPVEAIAPVAPIVERTPVAPVAPKVDFTPLSDDLLPRRKR
jgi:hypothetical protein